MSNLTTTKAAHDKDMSRDFLTCLDPSADKFTFQFFSDGDDGYAEIFHGTFDEMWPRVQALNTPDKRIGVFVTVNETDFRGRTADNVVRVRALFVDADNDEQVKRCNDTLAASGITPSMFVKTGRGAHFYFCTDDVPREQFRTRQESLIDKLGTDAAIKDLPRVMRLPGTLHLKDPGNPWLVRLQRASGPVQRWKSPELAAKLGLSAPAKPVSPPASATDPARITANFTAADRERVQKIFGPLQEIYGKLDGSLSDGLETDIEEIRSAVSAIPPSAISEEADWMDLARALAREAAIYKKQSEELWEVLDTASRPAPRYDELDNRSRWLRYINEAFARENPITIATVFHLAKKHGWQGWSPAVAATSASGTKQVNSHRAVPIASLPLIPPKRRWVHGTDLMRGAVSMLVAPGARAKTTWLLTSALACASGRSLLGAHVYGGPKRVLYLSAEDSTNEIALWLRAAMQHHGLSDTDVSGLSVIGAENWGLPLLGGARGTLSIDQRGWGALNAELDRLEPDVLVLDPLINLMGGVDSNDNSAAALLMGQLVALAARRGIAVMIAHHAAKGRDPTSAESAMGAASFVNLSRIVLSIEPLAEKDAGRLGLPPWEAKSVFRVGGTKQNFSPPNTEDRWFRISSVEIQNQQPPIYVNGDKVAVVEVFQPGASGPVFPPQLIRDALVAVDLASPPLAPSRQSRDRYAVRVIAEAIAHHRGGRKSDVEGKAVLDHLVASGLVHVQPVKLTRPGARSDTRNGLILTPAGRAVMQQANQGVSNFPQSPQSPAESTAGTAENAGGDPPSGSPHC